MASPDQIRAWSHGEVTKPETINYRTLKPERDGLYCERIFGPTKDWECNCGKYKRVRNKGIVCDKCGVEVTRSKVRRERMGHIELAAPVSHIWYFKGIPSRMGTLLDISPRALEKVLYFASYIVLDPGCTPLRPNAILTETEYRQQITAPSYTADVAMGKAPLRVGMGAEAVRELLQKLDLDQLSQQLRAEIAELTEKERERETEGQKRAKAIKRLEVVEAFRSSGNKPEWMILEVIPVMPPDLRPMVQLDGGRFATSDLNDLYRRVINRNNRLKRLLELGAPDIIVRNEKRMLQEAVDALIDNGRRGRPVTGPGNRALKSLSDFLRGKQGRFRQNLLGKRVDYSGRSVIVVGPELKLHQCGLPKGMALELFKPFVMERLVNTGIVHNVKSAKRMVDRGETRVWDILESVIKEHPVLLNRAPTLHRLGIQAFEPILVEGKAMKLHPLACTAFNADFDGDQMAVHVPLSMEAQAEARFLMLCANNILKPQDGKPVISPSQDMVIGCYYLSCIRPGAKGEGRCFANEDEAMMAYLCGQIDLQSRITVRIARKWDGEVTPEYMAENHITGGNRDHIYYKRIETCLGRLILNSNVPQDMGFKPRNTLNDMFELEIDMKVGKKQLGQIVDMCFRKHGVSETARVLDNVKAMGYKYSTIGAVTVAVADVIVPPEKKPILEASEKKVRAIEKQFKRGLLTDEERYERVVEVWSKTTDDVKSKIMDYMDEFNPIRMMTDSGARGSISQVSQLAGMRGMMASPTGRPLEMPVKANFREGLTVLEFFQSSHGSRKALSDTALRTADSGYLTRRLVDVSQEVIIREEDCHATEGIWVREISEGNSVVESFKERLNGRYSLHDVHDPATGELLVSKEKMMDMFDAEKIVNAGITELEIRSVMTCRAHVGVCAHCYGSNMSNGECVKVGESVGIIAAESIGEPGTQLTMRTFHTGGIASAEDITQGLPRVEELFESRRPKAMAIMSEIAGTVHIDDTKKSRHAEITGTDESGAPVTKSYLIPFGQRLKVMEGDEVAKGALLTEGHAYPQDILAIQGPIATQNYLISEVQKVYRLQGVDINDKHIEVIVRQMMRKVRIEDSGSSDFIMGSIVNRRDVMIKNEEIQARIDAGETDLKLVQASQVLLGITKSSLATDSFLSAASFQETTRVLTEAAIKGKVDPLAGLKENVIIGKLIPAGTGLPEVEEELVQAEIARDAAEAAYDH